MKIQEELRLMKQNVSADFLASFVVFLVALPLCMGIAVASGVPPALGLITGIVGGLVVGMVSGAPLQVSGPAAGLTVVVWELVGKFGLRSLGPILLVAGLLQAIAGWCKLGRWFRAVPPSIIHGMLAGIGVLIVASQVHVMVDDAPRGAPLQNLISIPGAVWKGIYPLDGTVHHLAAAMGLLTIVVLLLWNNFAPKRLRTLPGALIGVVVATATAHWFDMPIARVSVPDSLLGAANTPSLSAFNVLADPSAWMAVVTLAVIASAETLLCASALDSMHSGQRTRYNQELAAQGFGNTICGLLGALPMTGVIVRSSANVLSGGKTRAATIMHGVWLLAFVMVAPMVLRWIPVSSLAAVLVFTGYKLINPGVIRSLRVYGRGEVIVFVATVVGIVATDLLKGIAIGIVLALVKLLYRFSHLTVRIEHDVVAQRTVIRLKGSATFLRLPELSQALEAVPPKHELVVELDDLEYIDHASIQLLSEWEKQHRNQGGHAMIGWDHLRFLSQSSANAVSEERNARQDALSPLKEEAPVASQTETNSSKQP